MKLTTKLLTFTASVLLAVGGQAVAQTPKDQIALQLGAIQMGYTVPFAVSANSTATQKQQAVNSLVMGRNAMNATVSLPAATVKGVVKSPSVNTADYRDQLYSAVEYVVTSPVSASINGTVVMSNNATVTVNATALRAAAVSNDWMTPVPYALEARSSVDTQALREELVAAGVLKNTTTTNTSQTKSFFFITSSSEINATEALKGAGTQKVLPIFKGKYEPFEQWLQRKIDTNDRIIVRDGNFWNLQTTVSYGFRETLTIVYQQFSGDKATTNLQLWCAMPVEESDPKSCTLFSPGLSAGTSIATATLLGGTVTKPVPPQINSQITFRGIPYKVIPLGGLMPSGTTTSFKVEK